jgi:hypothetical protein
MGNFQSNKLLFVRYIISSHLSFIQYDEINMFVLLIIVIYLLCCSHLKLLGRSGNSKEMFREPTGNLFVAIPSFTAF